MGKRSALLDRAMLDIESSRVSSLSSFPLSTVERSWKNEWHGLSIARPVGGGGVFAPTTPSHSALSIFHRPIYSVHAKPRALYKDLVYILLNLRWSRLALALTCFYVGVTLAFACVFYFVCGESADVWDAFNYSYQAFSTIGFGIVYPTTRCGNYFIVFEMMISMLAIPAMTGLVFSKFSLAHVKLALSTVGVVHPCYQGDVDALVFRVANASSARHLHRDILMNVSVSLELFRVEALETPRPVLRRYHLAVKQADFLMLRLAMQVVHVIDDSSPLHGICPADLDDHNFMVQLTVQGVDSNRHATVVDSRLYTSSDIHWGRRFEPMMFPPTAQNVAWRVEFDKLDATTPISDNMSPCHTAHHAPCRRRSLSEPRRHDWIDHIEAQFLAQTQPLIRVDTGMDDEYSIASVGLYPTTLIEAKDAPHYFQYTYYHLLHMKWTRILLGLLAIVLTSAAIFGAFHVIRFNEGLFIAEDMRPPAFTPFELCFFLSIHTLSTVGFGDIAPAPNDHYHNFLVALEALMGISLMAIVTGIAWSKFALPQAHVKFSAKMVATTLHGHRCLLFRAANTRHMGDVAACEFKLSAFFEDRHGTRMMHDLALVEPKWPSINVPVTLIHIVDEASPLARYALDELHKEHMVMLAVVSGFDTTFCETVFARHMYSEFVTDKAFEDVVHLTHSYLQVNWAKLDSDAHEDADLRRTTNMTML
ncbi:Aste57867_11150 [Aphanomyces stellatus]|uniref:Aste57867_11150 protein n=1 Tax=Aphanomyces stellatus TaxID=120398 RepID=A0A485KSP9_9STRA|nr:hypothetical protein As57867_011108 [Aphanomyces stellatus]VFT88017.1 Aste57867_11150 [Aphanomyces stellatus]